MEPPTKPPTKPPIDGTPRDEQNPGIDNRHGGAIDRRTGRLIIETEVQSMSNFVEMCLSDDALPDEIDDFADKWRRQVA